MTALPTYKQGDRVSTPQGMGYIAGIYDHDPLHVNDYPIKLDGEDELVPFNKYEIRPETFWQFLWKRPAAFGKWSIPFTLLVAAGIVILIAYGWMTIDHNGWVGFASAAGVLAWSMGWHWANYTKRMV